MNADEKLIEAVREYPCLWLVNSKTYKDAVAKGNAWKEVASQVKATTRKSMQICRTKPTLILLYETA